MAEDHRERRVADSSKLQEIVSNLAKVRNDTRMLSIHDELMHAIDKSMDTHGGHRFQPAEIEIIKDVAFQIVYILDPANRQPRGFFRVMWQEWRQLPALTKIIAIAGVLGFLGGGVLGSITFYEKVVRPTTEQPAKVAPVAPTPAQPVAPIPPPATQPTPPGKR